MITLKNNKSNLKIIQEITKLVTKSTIIITSLFIFQAAANNPTENSLDTIDVNNTAIEDTQNNNKTLINAISNNFKVTSNLKIVSLSPEITHILKKLNYEQNIVAVDKSSSKLELINTVNTNNKEIHVVADYYSVNLEKFLSLDFDYIFVNTEFNFKFLPHLEKLFPNKIIKFCFKNINDISKNYQEIGKLLHLDSKGKEISNSINQFTNNIKNKYQSFNTKNIGIIIWNKPLMVAGNKTFLNEYIKLCNANNVFKEIGNGYPHISVEKVLTTKLDKLISITDSKQHLSNYLKNITIFDSKLKNLTLLTDDNLKNYLPLLCDKIHSN